MKRVLWVIVGIIIGAGGLYALPSQAQYDRAPVQVQYRMDDVLVMYDCYPAIDDAAALQVYTMHRDGIAVYNCESVSGKRVLPIYPYSRYTNLSATY